MEKEYIDKIEELIKRADKVKEVLGKDYETVSKWLSDIIVFIEVDTSLPKNDIIYDDLKRSFSDIENVKSKDINKYIGSLQSFKENYEDIKSRDYDFN